MISEFNFYVVMSDKRCSERPFRHESEHKAAEEAERLSRCNPGEHFYVLRAMTAYKFPAFDVERFPLSERIPF